jgi:hypothetical protein
MKPFLLIAGDSYYPQSGVSDWIRTYATFEEAKSAVSLIQNKRTITKGNRKGEEEVISTDYKIGETRYDWYDIVDLREWIE